MFYCEVGLVVGNKIIHKIGGFIFMSMQNEMVYVIKNQDGLFVNPKFRALFSGITSGFTFYGSEDLAREKLSRLGGLDELNGCYLDYINLKDVPRGERIYRE